MSHLQHLGTVLILGFVCLILAAGCGPNGDGGQTRYGADSGRLPTASLLLTVDRNLADGSYDISIWNSGRTAVSIPKPDLFYTIRLTFRNADGVLVEPISRGIPELMPSGKWLVQKLEPKACLNYRLTRNEIYEYYDGLEHVRAVEIEYSVRSYLRKRIHDQGVELPVIGDEKVICPW